MSTISTTPVSSSTAITCTAAGALVPVRGRDALAGVGIEAAFDYVLALAGEGRQSASVAA